MAPTGVEETGVGTGEYKVIGAGLKAQVDHLFRSGTAAAVIYDIARILALKTNILKREQQKDYNLKAVSEAFLKHLVDIETVKDKDQVLLVVKHLGRMLDVFLERREEVPLFPAVREMYDQRVIFCFRDSENFQQMSIDQVPGLQTIKEYHDSGKLFLPGRRGRPPLKRVQEGQPDTDTNTNASASLRVSTTSAKGKSARGREKKNVNVSEAAAGVAAEVPHAHLSPQQIEGNAAAEAVSGPLPSPQNEEGDVAAAVGDVASGYLAPPQMDDGAVAEVAFGHLPPQTQADVAAAVAEVASGDLSLPQTEDCSLLLNVDWAEAEAAAKVGVEAKAKAKVKARASIMVPRLPSANSVPTSTLGSPPSSCMYNNRKYNNLQAFQAPMYGTSFRQ